MRSLDDTARFLADEHEAVVIAALMCPCCLRRPAHVLLTNHAEPAGAQAMCACGECGLQWSVAVDADQARRLFLSPPQGLWIQHSFHSRP